jgi:hypothetical protein
VGSTPVFALPQAVGNDIYEVNGNPRIGILFITLVIIFLSMCGEIEEYAVRAIRLLLAAVFVHQISIISPSHSASPTVPTNKINKNNVTH